MNNIATEDKKDDRAPRDNRDEKGSSVEKHDGIQKDNRTEKDSRAKEDSRGEKSQAKKCIDLSGSKDDVQIDENTPDKDNEPTNTHAKKQVAAITPRSLAKAKQNRIQFEVDRTQAMATFQLTSTQTGDLSIDYLKDVHVDNSLAETIFTETRKVLTDDLNCDGFLGFGSDGCNTMIGKKSVVTTRLKASKPELLTVHCSKHRLALAAKDSFESILVFRENDDSLSHLF
ncbi:hypothetical protein ScPMuIL_003270 [Solemya velum]